MEQEIKELTINGVVYVEKDSIQSKEFAEKVPPKKIFFF